MNVRRMTALVVCLLASLSAAIAQPRVDPMNKYARLIVIVPMVGQGTPDDPHRPEYVPVVKPTASLDTIPFLGMAVQVSDDGKTALVEFVAKDNSAFQTMLADTSIQTFLKGRDTRQAAEGAFRKYKADFNIANFGVRVP